MRTENIFYLLLIIGVVFTMIFLFYNTNVYYTQKNTQDTKYIYVTHESFLDQEVVFLQLQRNPTSPSSREFASFSNGQEFTYVTTTKNKVTKVPVLINIPFDVDGGIYFIDYSITRGEETFTHTPGLKVKVR